MRLFTMIYTFYGQDTLLTLKVPQSSPSQFDEGTLSASLANRGIHVQILGIIFQAIGLDPCRS